MVSVHHCFIGLPERQRLPRCYTPHRLGGGLQPLRTNLGWRLERLLGRLRRGGYLPADFPSVQRRLRSYRKSVSIPIFSSILHTFVCSRIDHCNSLLVGLPKFRLAPFNLY